MADFDAALTAQGLAAELSKAGVPQIRQRGQGFKALVEPEEAAHLHVVGLVVGNAGVVRPGRSLG